MSARRLLATVAILGIVVLAGCSGGLGDEGVPPTTAGDERTPTAVGATGTPAPAGTLSVHLLNVGQGSSTLVIGPDGETILIDTGDWTDDGAAVIAYLEAHGVTRIDHLVTSHADADHIGGHAAVIEHFETNGDGVGTVYDPGIASSSATYEAYLDAVDAYNVTLYRAQAGDSIRMSGVDVRILAPPAGYLANEDRNENSIVLRLQFGASSFLFPGDGETASEAYLVEAYGDRLDSTVLVVGHHGSRSSTSEPFLDAASPKAAVVSSAYESQYGHPHDATLSRLAARSVQTYWTATHGTIRFTSNGSAVTVATQQAAPTTATALRAGEPVTPGAPSTVTGRFVIHADQAVATPAVDSDTTVARDPVSLDLVERNADADGDDAENLNGEYVTFENTGPSSLDLSGWQVADAAEHSYTIPEGTVLEPGARLTIYTGSGTNTASELHWNRSTPVWNNGGDTIIVRDDTGSVVIEESY